VTSFRQPELAGSKPRILAKLHAADEYPAAIGMAPMASREMRCPPPGMPLAEARTPMLAPRRAAEPNGVAAPAGMLKFDHDNRILASRNTRSEASFPGARTACSSSCLHSV